MSEIVVAFYGEKTREYMAGLFTSAGITVKASCGTGAEILSAMKAGEAKVVLCGYELNDMVADDLWERLPKNTAMVLLATEEQLKYFDCQGVRTVAAPAHRDDVLAAVREALKEAAEKSAIPKRSDADKLLITRAKEQIMEQRMISEDEAYRFIQRTSMNMGAKMIDTARKILAGTLSA